MAHAPAPGDKKNIVKMAYIYFQEGRWDKAIEEYRKLLAIDPDDMNTHNMLGDVFVKKGAIKEAYDEYTKVSAELNNRGQQDKGVVVQKKIAALDPTTLPPDARTKQSLIKQSLKAEAAMEQGDFQTAIDAFSEVLKLDPENLPAYGKLADLLVSKGKVSEAVQQFAVLGAAFLKNRLYKKALETFQKIVDLDPNQVEARINLAQIYIKQGSESDAKKEFLTVAEIYMQQGDLEKAQQYASKAIEFKSIEAHYVLGQALFRRRQYAEAKGEFENLLRFKVNHVGALTHLGLVHLELNQMDKAAEQLAKAQKAEKDNPKVMEALAELNLKKGLKNEAVTLLVQASEWYHNKKDYRKAVETAQKAESIDYQSAAALWAMGIALKDEGQKSEAVTVLVRALPLFEQQGMKIEAESAQRLIEELSGRAAAPSPPHAETPAKAPPAPVHAGEDQAPSDNVLDLDSDAETAAHPAEAPAAEPAAELEPGPMEVEAASAETPAPASDEIIDEPETQAVSEAPPAEEAVQAPAPVEELPPISPEEELHTQLEIAANYIRQNLVEEAIEIYQQLLESNPDNPEVRAKLNEAYTLYVKGGDEVIGALEAERKAKEEEEKRLREEVERRARDEQDRKGRTERERKAREEVEIRFREDALLKAKREADIKMREEGLQKAKLEAERLLKGDRFQPAKGDTEKRMRGEIERKLREEVEQKLRGEMDRKTKEEVEKKLRAEMDRKTKEEVEKKLRAEMERKLREETERKSRGTVEREGKSTFSRKAMDEVERKSKELHEKAARHEADHTVPRINPKAPAASEESKDDFMTIAVADIYVRQGLYEEAHKIYRRITEMEADNFEAKKKLSDLENLMKTKGLQIPSASPAASAPPAKETPAAVPPSQGVSTHEKDSVAKKKHGKVGYV